MAAACALLLAMAPPPALGSGSELDQLIRQGRYLTAAQRVDEMEGREPGAMGLMMRRAMIDDWIEEQIESGPNGPKFPYASGHQAFFRRDWKAAAQWLGEAALLEPKNQEIPQFAAKARGLSGEGAGAALAQDEKRASELYAVALEALRQGDFNKALALAMQALNAAPYEPAKNLVSLIREAPRERVGGRLLPADPGEGAHASFFQALRYYAQGELGRAIELLQKAARLDPANMEFRETLKSAESERAALGGRLGPAPRP